jgi:hypothetical protein
VSVGRCHDKCISTYRYLPVSIGTYRYLPGITRIDHPMPVTYSKYMRLLPPCARICCHVMILVSIFQTTIQDRDWCCSTFSAWSVSADLITSSLYRTGALVRYTSDHMLLIYKAIYNHGCSRFRSSKPAPQSHLSSVP